MTDLTIFYVADIHGSDLCFRKWLNAAGFYGADILIIGGDLTGKVLLPIYPVPGTAERWTATWRDRRHELETRQEVDALIETASKTGAYGFLTTPEEVAEIQGSIEREREVFAELKVAALTEWVAWADERLADQNVRALVMPGNDDPPEMDAVIAGSARLEDVHGRAVELAPGIWMASRGESTPTPWHTPREVPDEELGRLVEQATAEIPEDAFAIWNIHNPPYNSGVDLAPRLDDGLRIQYSASGEAEMAPVGARSVRRLIEERQPELCLHGHIHEGRGRYRMGRTVGFNPGSVYSDGVLYGVLVRVSRDRGIRSYSLTSG